MWSSIDSLDRSEWPDQPLPDANKGELEPLLAGPSDRGDLYKLIHILEKQSHSMATQDQEKLLKLVNMQNTSERPGVAELFFIPPTWEVTILLAVLSVLVWLLLSS